MTTRYLALLALIVCFSISVCRASKCFPSCRFRLCSDEKSFRGGRSDVARTGAICLNGVAIGAVGSVGETYVYTDRAIPISKWKPEGLRQHFAPHFLGIYPLEGKPGHGIGHQRPQTNQGRFAIGKCYKIPIRSYQALNLDGTVKDNVHLNDVQVDCIAVRLLAPRCPVKKV